MFYQENLSLGYRIMFTNFTNFLTSQPSIRYTQLRTLNFTENFTTGIFRDNHSETVLGEQHGHWSTAVRYSKIINY